MYPSVVTLGVLGLIGGVAFYREGPSAFEGLRDRTGYIGLCLLMLILLIAFVIPELIGPATPWHIARAYAGLTAIAFMFVFLARVINEGREEHQATVNLVRGAGIAGMIGILVAGAIRLIGILIA